MRGSRLSEQFLAIYLHRSRSDRSLCRPAKDCTRGHVELAAMTSARHGGPRELAVRQGTARVGAGVVERVQVSARVRYVDFRAGDIEDTHLSVTDGRRSADPYQHGLA